MDPHRILGTTPKSTSDEITAAYRRRARKHHPDAGGDDWAFILIERAYQYLISGQTARWHGEMAWSQSPSTSAPTPSAEAERPSAARTTESKSSSDRQTDDAAQSQSNYGQHQTPWRRVSGILEKIAASWWTMYFLRTIAGMPIGAFVVVFFSAATGLHLPQFSLGNWQSVLFWTLFTLGFGTLAQRLPARVLFQLAGIGLIVSVTVFLSIKRERDRVKTLRPPIPAESKAQAK